MNTFNLVLSVLLHLSLLSHIAGCTYPTERKLPLLQALRATGLESYADFLEQYPTPEMNYPDIIVFAPTNKAVKAYLAANPDSKRVKVHRRAAAVNIQVNENNIGIGATVIANLTEAGMLITTGGGDPEGNKVAKPSPGGGDGGGSGPGESSGSKTPRARNLDLGERTDSPKSYYATITAGGGVRTKVLQEGLPFQNGLIYAVDGFFNPTMDFGATITAPSGFNLTYLRKIFERIPHAREKLFRAQKITFLAPTQEAFDKTGLKACTSKTRLLQEFLDNHTITSGFLGYTPLLKDGKCYTTDGGSQFVPKFNGTHTLLNDTVIVGPDHIVTTGVIQIINKVLYRPK